MEKQTEKAKLEGEKFLGVKSKSNSMQKLWFAIWLDLDTYM